MLLSERVHGSRAISSVSISVDSSIVPTSVSVKKENCRKKEGKRKKKKRKRNEQKSTSSDASTLPVKGFLCGGNEKRTPTLLTCRFARSAVSFKHAPIDKAFCQLQ
eukprot:876605-Rhodomonas_salina.1